MSTDAFDPVLDTDDALDDVFGKVDRVQRTEAGPGLPPSRVTPDEWGEASDEARAEQYADELPDGDVMAAAQTMAALHRLHEDTSSFPRFPLASLERLAGAHAPDEMWVVQARQSNGKSLFLQNWAHWLIEQGVPTLYMGTEQDAHVLRIKQACVKAGVNPRLVLKPRDEEKATTHWQAAWADVQEAARWLELDPKASQLYFANTRYISREILAKWVAGGVRKYGIKYVIVDHLHHMDHGPGKSPVEELTATVHLAKDLACRFHLGIMCASQVKRTGGDALKQFTPPDAEDAAGSSAIERTADVVLSLWRPLRTDLADDDLRDMRKAAQRGASGEDKVYMPGVMGVRLVKDRLGDAPGAQCMLRVDRGRIGELDAAQRAEMESARHAIRTNRDLALPYGGK